MSRPTIRCLVLAVVLSILPWPHSAKAAAPGSTASAPSTQPSAVASCGGLLFPIEVDRKHGYIDYNGNVVIPPRFNMAMPFGEDGFAVVWHGSASAEREYPWFWGQPAVINRRGEIVLEGGFESLGRGRFAVVDGEFIRIVGLLEPFETDVRCTRVRGSFQEGLLAVEVDGKWGFMDESGKLAIPAKYDWAGWFTEGLAVAMVGEKSGYIDHTGRWAIEPLSSILTMGARASTADWRIRGG